MSTGGNLLARINVFLAESLMPPSVFGRQAVRDPRLVSDLRNGREPSADIVRRVEAYMKRWRAQYRAGFVQPMGDRRCRQYREGQLADDALRMSQRNPRKAVELLRVAIESIQPLVQGQA